MGLFWGRSWRSKIFLVSIASEGFPIIVVDNTHTRKWEYSIADRVGTIFGYRIRLIDLFDGGRTDGELCSRCVHNVPAVKIGDMRRRWEP